MACKEYREQFSNPICVCGFEYVFSVGQLDDFGDTVRPVLDCIEHLSTHELVFSRIVSLYFIARFLTAVVTGQRDPARAKLPWIPDKISEAGHYWLALSRMRSRFLTGFVSVVMPRLNGVNIEAVMCAGLTLV